MSALRTSMPSKCTSAWHAKGVAKLTTVRNTRVEQARKVSPASATRYARTTPVTAATKKLTAKERGVWKNAIYPPSTANDVAPNIPLNGFAWMRHAAAMQKAEIATNAADWVWLRQTPPAPTRQ